MLGHSAFSNNLGSRRILVQAIRSSSPRCSNGRIKQRPKPNVNLIQRCIHAGPICSNINDRRPFDPIEAAKARYSQRNRSLLMYSTATILVALGLSYAAVPLYRAFCAATGFGGTPQTGTGKFDPERLHAIPGARPIKVTFNSATSEALPWKFTPQQKHVWVLPGETSLAFYTAKNNSKEDVIGIATYNVIPDRVAPYFAKVECFCFEEQRLLAGEEVDMPLFFFIDKDILEDPSARNVTDIVLSYTFFKARRNQQGHLEPDAPREVVDASLGWSEYEHASPSQSKSENKDVQ
ncbi:Cytochrome c oxidase assembly protein cox11, mitochondrial [Serendipita sp. 411]|nr:Cytochrome c oxidase assembly protein cox11, mitochondrial [Serendipita sp. 400]KAG8858579.1 Cytochrome c oxidase assembly protein cox11, mitochondrial [Serendipita sp. 411]